MPNILFIMTDDHAANALSCYGSVLNKTPNMDKIANAGIKFTNCFVANALCSPSRATLLTGKYSHLNGITGNKIPFDEKNTVQTFPKMLQSEGYQTALVGKWHLHADPNGFDYWFKLTGRNEQGWYKNPKFNDNGTEKTVNGYVTDIITDKTLEFLENRDPAKPFCILCNHKAPHRQWEPDDAHKHMYDNTVFPEPPNFWDEYANRASAAEKANMRVADLGDGTVGNPPASLQTQEERTAWKFQSYMRRYLACVASVDDNIGRLLDYLETEGLKNNTLVVYTSDNGFFLGEHGWYDKRFMYEESIRIPCLAMMPGTIPAGITNDNFIGNIDYASTFLDLAGIRIPSDFQGNSLLPLMKGQPVPGWRTSFYYHYHEFPNGHNAYENYGVRSGRYKLIYYPLLKEWEFFNLQSDPNEMTSLYDDPGSQAKISELKSELDRLRVFYGEVPATAIYAQSGHAQRWKMELARKSLVKIDGEHRSIILPAKAQGIDMFDLHGRIRGRFVRRAAEGGDMRIKLPKHLRSQFISVRYFKIDD
ncbi:MAG: sulfatase-like hydrolase/transferase [Chitinivibrionales bacterium]|nr:sulfatase-like hydrolase/transferase [Chitinivibrionales bacterium]